MRKDLSTVQPVPVDLGELGPAMQALPTDRMRAFVVRLIEGGGRANKYITAYIEAGYQVSNPNSHGADVNAWKLAHDQRIQAAIREESLNRMGAAALAASSFLVELLNTDDPTVKVGMKLKAAGMILNRVGLHETTEHVVKTERKQSDSEKVEAIIRLAEKLGLDPKMLLGRAGVEVPGETVIEAEDVELVGSTAGLEDLL